MQTGVTAEARHHRVFKSIQCRTECSPFAAWNVSAVVNGTNETRRMSNGAQIAIAIHGPEPARRVI
jgi:hypothetical protein